MLPRGSALRNVALPSCLAQAARARARTSKQFGISERRRAVLPAEPQGRALAA
jgi:hypothetical protein